MDGNLAYQDDFQEKIREELIGGKVVAMSPRPSWNHNRVSFNIAHIFEKIAEAQEAGLRIRLKLSCSLADCGIDDIHMVEILGTLLDNAIQDMIATKQKEFLYIEVKYEEGIIIRVANPHKKIKNPEMRLMFEKGYSTKGEGRGIGLYNVRELVKKYKVDLAVENQSEEEQNYICFSLVIKESTP